MAHNFLCAEDTNSCFNDNGFDYIATGISHSFWHQDHSLKDCFNDYNNENNKNSCKSDIGFVICSDDRIKEMVEIETDYVPKNDYLKRLRIGDLDMSFRRQAIDWIFKVQAHYSFGALAVCLCMNYLDRFLSVCDLPKGKSWTVQLLAVACLSIAAKMEETEVPLSIDLQVGDPKFVFEAKTIQRMELVVLSTLKWRMLSITPYSFIDYFLIKISNNNKLSQSIVIRSLQLILNIIKGIDFLEFRPSEIAASVAIFVIEEVQRIGNDKAMDGFIHVEKDRVVKCIELIKDLSLINGVENGSISSIVPQSPNGVLDLEVAYCLSHKSDDFTTTIGSFQNSSSNSTSISPHTKRRKSNHDMDNNYKS